MNIVESAISNGHVPPDIPTAIPVVDVAPKGGLDPGQSISSDNPDDLRMLNRLERQPWSSEVLPPDVEDFTTRIVARTLDILDTASIPISPRDQLMVAACRALLTKMLDQIEKLETRPPVAPAETPKALPPKRAARRKK